MFRLISNSLYDRTKATKETCFSVWIDEAHTFWSKYHLKFDLSYKSIRVCSMSATISYIKHQGTLLETYKSLLESVSNNHFDLINLTLDGYIPVHRLAINYLESKESSIVIANENNFQSMNCCTSSSNFSLTT